MSIKPPAAKIRKAALEKRGVLELGYPWPSDLNMLATKFPVTKLSDVKGVKIRTYGQGMTDAWQAFGAVPVAIQARQQVSCRPSPLRRAASEFL